jgi:hypothetical protein
MSPLHTKPDPSLEASSRIAAANVAAARGVAAIDTRARAFFAAGRAGATLATLSDVIKTLALAIDNLNPGDTGAPEASPGSGAERSGAGLDQSARSGHARHAPRNFRFISRAAALRRCAVRAESA